MAKATLSFEGITTLNDLTRAVELARWIGFPTDSAADSPTSGIAGARLSVSTNLHLVPDPEWEPDLDLNDPDLDNPS